MMQINLFDSLFADTAESETATPTLKVPPISPKLEREVLEFPRPKTQTILVVGNTPLPSLRRDFVLRTRSQVVIPGETARIQANLEALRVLQTCRSENRPATAEEQDILARWCSWGPVARLFDEPTPPELHPHMEALTSLLSESELQETLSSAQRTVTNAFYTDPDIASGIWKGIQTLGTEGISTIVEPAAGSGIFLGTMPETISLTSQVFAGELDILTAEICALLYPSAKVRKGPFQNFELPPSSVDLFISNVPFANVVAVDENDVELRSLSANIHDYFFAKALKALRPGGLAVFISSIGTLDKKNAEIREWLAARADLVGALRLPNSAFAGNANTKVVTDLIVLQKRSYPRDATENTPAWVKSQPWNLDKDVPWVNTYFTKNPAAILGAPTIKAWTAKGEVIRQDFLVESDGRDLSQSITSAFQAWKGHGHLKLEDWNQWHRSNHLTPIPEEKSIPFLSSLPDWSFVHHEGQFWVYNAETLRPLPFKMGMAKMICLKDALAIRDVTMELLQAQRNTSADANTDTLRKSLNSLYDSFVQRHGPLNGCTCTKILRKDYGTGHYLLALENWDSTKKTATKADIFNQSTQVPFTEPTSANSATDALAISLSVRGKINLPYMASLTGLAEDALIDQLKGKLFNDPAIKTWVTSDLYLTGQVRTKLKIARMAAELDPAYQENLSALEAAIPADFGPDRISLALGASWIPTQAYRNFLEETIGGNWEVVFVRSTETFTINHSTVRASSWNIESTVAKRTSEWLVSKIMRSEAIVVESSDPIDGSKIVHTDETAQANYKADQLRGLFQNWVWASDYWGPKVVKIYNDLFNDWVPTKYNGGHLLQDATDAVGTPVKILRGQNPIVQLRDHQVDFAWRVVNAPTALAQHVVGTGKTYSLIAAAMESRRLGLTQKAMITSPNYVFAQFASMWRNLYPDARLLLIDPTDLKKETRPITMSRIATGNWDGIVIAHSSFTKIPLSPEYQKRFFDEAFAKIHAEMTEGDAKSKELQRAKARLESRMSRLEARWNKDKGPFFDELGIDFLACDESHLFKNLFLPSRMTESGVNTAQDVQRAWDMMAKCHYLQSKESTKVVFATGTPVSNSMTELYVNMKYLMPAYLDSIGMDSFDSWARTYGKVVPEIEATVDGSGVRVKSRFRKFVNLVPLQMMWNRISDNVKLSDTNIEVPAIIGGKVEKVLVERSDFQAEYVEEIKERIEAIMEGNVDPRKDNMLKVVGDGRKLALDQRLINPFLLDDPNSKINTMVSKAHEFWLESASNLGTQLIWCDLGTPSKRKAALQLEPENSPEPEEEESEAPSIEACDGEPEINMDEADEFEEPITGMNLYDDIREKLVARGIPREQVAFIHEAKTKEQRASLFQAFSDGDVRIIIASTGKLSMGANIQKRLFAAHHLHPTWKPAEMEQRDGRIIRQGNSYTYLGGVRILAYLTSGSFDAYMFQLLENKANFLDQFFSGKGGVDEIDNIEFASDAFAELKAAAAADPRIMEMVKLQHDVKNLEVRKRSRSSEIFSVKQRIRNVEESSNSTKKQLDVLNPVAAEVTEMTVADFLIQGKTYETHKELGTAIWMMIFGRTKDVKIGSARGIEVLIRQDGKGQDISWIIHTNVDAIGWKTTNSTNPISIARAILDLFNQIPERIRNLTEYMETNSRFLKELQKQLEATQEFGEQAELDEKMIRLAYLQKELQATNPKGKRRDLEWQAKDLTYTTFKDLFETAFTWNGSGLAVMVSRDRDIGGNKIGIEEGLKYLISTHWEATEAAAIAKIGRKDRKGRKLRILADCFRDAVAKEGYTGNWRERNAAIDFLKKAGLLHQVKEFAPDFTSLPTTTPPRPSSRVTDIWESLLAKHAEGFSRDLAPHVVMVKANALGHRIPHSLTADVLRGLHKQLIRAEASQLSKAA